MSLILDALKKSEAERQRGQVPNLLSPSPATTTYYSANKKSPLPWIILTAILLVALVFGFVYMKSGDVETPDTSSATATVISQPPKASPETTTPSVTVAPANLPEPIATPASPVSQAPPANPPSPFASQTAAETVKPAVETIEPLPEIRIAGMAEMPVDQRQQLPALKLSMHVYSSEFCDHRRTTRQRR
jgi:general secretion pathway protein B